MDYDSSNQRGNMNARSVARRQKKDSSVWDERFHLSKSLESSRKWFSRQVAQQLQRGGRFRDPFLKPDDSTIGPGLCARGRHYDWLRPHVSELKESYFFGSKTSDRLVSWFAV
ncbi:hypothetical protein AHF37_07473 [Paragonimus kellicotti]|nr:hypothetical protein AHF37_07473 [Paragonimus kellicotti]